MKPIIDQLNSYQKSIQTAGPKLDLVSKQQKLESLQAAINQPDFWANNTHASQLSAQAVALQKEIDTWNNLESDIADLIELASISDEADLSKIEAEFASITKRYESAMKLLKLSGEFDNNSAILQISAGAGGTDAADWAQMLMSMYVKYCEKNDLVASLMEVSYGDEAGIKSATIQISGPYAYGLLKSEKGVHRLVRLSPYNAQNLRQTSFALVDVIPEITTDSVEIDPSDIRIDTYRASGHGGQGVNTTDSAVRVTHLPTGLTVAIQNERSQLKNKQQALKILSSKLAAYAREAHLKTVSELRGKLAKAEWGSQIRSYVLHPYSLVKDHRTNYQTNDTAAVLAGELNGFIEAYLQTA